MLKSRMMFGLVAIFMVMALAQSGYAQLSVTATGNPSPTETATNVTAETNDPTANVGLTITGTVLSDAPITGGRLRITYPSAVTNACTASLSTTSNGCGNGTSGGVTSPQNFPPADPITVSLATGIFTGATVVSVNAVSGRVDIALPCSTNQNGVANFGFLPGQNGNTMTGLNGTLVLQGVRIDASVLTSFPASATISDVAGAGIAAECPTTAIIDVSTTGGSVTPANVILNTTTVPVINASAAGVGGVQTGGIPTTVTTPSSSNTVPGGVVLGGCPSTGTTAFNGDCGVATIYTNRTIPKNTATFTVKEGQNWAWFNNSGTQFPGAQGFVNSAGFLLTFNNVPAGVTMTLAVAAFTSNMPTPSLSNTNITTANNTSTVTWNGDLSTTSLDWIAFRITNITVPTTGTVASGSITVSAKMNPVGTALDLSNGNGSAAIFENAFPRYTDTSVGNATIVNIVPANTTMLIPFATTIAAAHYDTGIAIANTSADPFGSQGASPQSGSVQANLFATSATGVTSTASVTTSATKKAGTGISADGTIAAGATWAVNLSDLLALAGVTGDFSGYIFIQANFLPAHGVAYIYNGSGFTSQTPILVLPPPSTNGRSGMNASLGAELLAP